MVLDLRRTCFQYLVVVFVAAWLIKKQHTFPSSPCMSFPMRRERTASAAQEDQVYGVQVNATQGSVFSPAVEGREPGGYLTPVSPPPVRTRWIWEEKDENLGRGDNEPRQH